MRKSFYAVNTAILFGLLTLFFALGDLIGYPYAYSFDDWLKVTFFVMLLFGTQNLMHLFLSRMQVSFSWQVFTVLACALMWVYLLFLCTSPETTMQEFILDAIQLFFGFLVVHGIILGDHLLTKHFMAPEEDPTRG